jgi:hypothetical protein
MPYATTTSLEVGSVTSQCEAKVDTRHVNKEFLFTTILDNKKQTSHGITIVIG